MPKKTRKLPRLAEQNLSWSIERTDTHAHALRLRYTKRPSRRTIYVLSDLHWDSAHCQRDVLASHLQAACDEDAPVLLFGDIFDIMQGKWDPRRDQSVLRPEHRGGRYLDAVLETAVEWFAPYAPQIALITPGNHETSVQQRNDTDLIQRLADGLRPHGYHGAVGQYWGWVILNCQRGMAAYVKKLHYSHGYGGGGEVTRGLIDQSRTRSQYEGGDVYVSGHIHRRNADENNPIRVSADGRLEIAQQYFLRCASYKLEHTDGWHVSKGRAARPIGGWAIDVDWQRARHGGQYREYLTLQPRML